MSFKYPLFLTVVFIFITTNIFASNNIDDYRPDGIDNKKWSSLKNTIQQTKLLPQPAGVGGNSIGLGGSVSIDANRAIVGASSMDATGIVYVLEYNGTDWVKTATLKPSDSNNQISFGYSVSLLGDRALIGAGAKSGKAYVFDYDGTTWNETQILRALDGENGDVFGRSVSLSFDRVVIGAEFDNLSPSLFLAGSAYVFDFDGTSWIETQKITANDAMRLDRFANVVSVNGDTILIGASNADGSFRSSGAVYVFNFDGTSWTQSQKLFGSSDQRSTNFGIVLSMSGNKALVGTRKEFSYLFTFDGTNWVEAQKFSNANGDYDYSSIKSVSLDDNHLVICGLNNTTTLYESSIFTNDGTNWIRTHQITSPDLSDNSSFASSVDISGGNLIIGSNSAIDINGNSSGAAFIYSNVGNIWENKSRFSITEDGSAGASFGYSVSLSGNRALVGAYDENSLIRSVGSAYIYEYDGLSWNEINKLTASDGEVNDYFGYSVSLVGDRAAIGAYRDDDNGDLSGSVYIFDFDGNQWTQTQKLLASDGMEFNYFGKSLSLTTDRVLIGAERNSNIGRGAAYVFDFNGLTWSESHKFTVLNSNVFGDALFISGDRAIIADSGDNQITTRAGSVYIFDYDGTNWIQTQKLFASDAERSDRFGSSVHMFDTSIIVGAKFDDSGTGAAYVFDYDGTSWNQTQKLVASDNASGFRFGNSVQIYDNTILIGSRRHSSASFTWSGSAYVFKNYGSGWVQNQQIFANDASGFDYFGRSVSLSSKHMLIGMDGDDTHGNNSGSAYLMVVDSIFKGDFE